MKKMTYSQGFLFQYLYCKPEKNKNHHFSVLEDEWTTVFNGQKPAFKHFNAVDFFLPDLLHYKLFLMRKPAH